MARDTVFTVLAYAQEYKNESMVDACLQFLANDFRWLVTQDDFLKLTFESMFALLQKVDKSANAIDCFNAIKSWYQSQGKSTVKDEEINHLVGVVDWSRVSEFDLVDMLPDLDDKRIR